MAVFIIESFLPTLFCEKLSHNSLNIINSLVSAEITFKIFKKNLMKKMVKEKFKCSPVTEPPPQCDICHNNHAEILCYCEWEIL